MFALKKNNHKRFETLIKPHTEFLYNMALKYCGNTYDAEDIVQETLYIALKKINQLREDSKSRSWAFTIMRNLFLKEQRYSQKRSGFEFDDTRDYLAVLEDSAQRTDIHESIEKKDGQEHMQKMLDRLPEKYKAPILLYFMKDMSYQEISEFLDIPAGTVMSRLSRGKALLKKEILRQAINEPAREKVVEMAEFKIKKDRKVTS